MNRLTFGQPPADPSDWRGEIRSATRNILADIARAEPGLDPASARSAVLSAARKALDSTEFIAMPSAEVDPASITPEDRANVHAGAFRVALILGAIRWQDATSAGAIMAEVRRTLDADPAGGEA